MPTAAELQVRLDEAEAALHKVLIGQQIVQLGEGDKRVVYGPGNVADLRAYITDLKVQLNQTAPTRRALGVTF